MYIFFFVSELISDNSVGLLFDDPLVTIYDFVRKIAPAPENPVHWVLISTIIRLIFHDCSGTSIPGLCDGCIDMNNLKNAGLFEGAIDPLSDICDYNNDRYFSFMR